MLICYCLIAGVCGLSDGELCGFGMLYYGGVWWTGYSAMCLEFARRGFLSWVA